MLVHEIAHGGCTAIVRESALKVDSVTKTDPLPHRRFEPVSTKCLSDALPTELHPQLAEMGLPDSVVTMYVVWFQYVFAILKHSHSAHH